MSTPSPPFHSFVFLGLDINRLTFAVEMSNHPAPPCLSIFLNVDVSCLSYVVEMSIPQPPHRRSIFLDVEVKTGNARSSSFFVCYEDH